MLIDKRKLPAMHYVYGTRPPHKCRECCNLRKIEVRHKQFLKRAAYGDTYGEATDWGANFLACGLLNVPFDDVPLLERIQQM